MSWYILQVALVGPLVIIWHTAQSVVMKRDHPWLGSVSNNHKWSDQYYLQDIVACQAPPLHVFQLFKSVHAKGCSILDPQGGRMESLTCYRVGCLSSGLVGGGFRWRPRLPGICQYISPPSTMGGTMSTIPNMCKYIFSQFTFLYSMAFHHKHISAGPVASWTFLHPSAVLHVIFN